MLNGMNHIPYGVDRCICRITEDYEMSEIGDYKIHSTSIMPLIEFAESEIIPDVISDDIFLNDEDTKVRVMTIVNSQNYITTKYIGRAPLEFYGPKTSMGRQFVLTIYNGNPLYKHRAFGTEDAINGYNRSASNNEILPK